MAPTQPQLNFNVLRPVLSIVTPSVIAINETFNITFSVPFQPTGTTGILAMLVTCPGLIFLSDGHGHNVYNTDIGFTASITSVTISVTAVATSGHYTLEASFTGANADYIDAQSIDIHITRGNAAPYSFPPLYTVVTHDYSLPCLCMFVHVWGCLL
jgi:ligand-binding sensor domain-containing protein